MSCSGVGPSGPTLPEMCHWLHYQLEWNSVQYHKHISIISWREPLLLWDSDSDCDTTHNQWTLIARYLKYHCDQSRYVCMTTYLSSLKWCHFRLQDSSIIRLIRNPKWSTEAPNNIPGTVIAFVVFWVKLTIFDSRKFQLILHPFECSDT